MIRINLLPFRAARKKENIRRQISIYVLSVVLLLVVIGFFFLRLTSTISSLETEKKQKKQELATYSKTIARIDEIKEKIEEIQAKLDVIKELEKNKTGPVRLLEEISAAVPKDRLYLSALAEKQGVLMLKGTATDNQTVALFMTNLEGQEHIKGVDLESTQLRNLKNVNLDVSEFVLNCKTYSFKEEEEATPRR
jgi:type IV pilus assembly protein PilN